MPLFTDQTGNTIELKVPPKRIVSLVPSQTELLAHLGLDAIVAGITKFCIHPDNWYRNKTRVGGTKMVNQAAVHRLKPDRTADKPERG
jgi:ABC-type Fe3+-hydroxamate transport system substrate-binding protein